MGTHIYDTPYDKDDPLNGEQCTIIDQPTKLADGNTLYGVQFDSGITMEVWAEELVEVEDVP